MLGLFGGYLACVLGNVIPPSEYIYGIQYAFYPYYISYALTKTVFYAIIITSVSSYFGYNVEGRSCGGGKIQHQGGGTEQYPDPAGKPDSHQNSSCNDRGKKCI